MSIHDRYGLSQEQIVEAETALEELAAQAQSREAINLLPLVNIMGALPLTSSLKAAIEHRSVIDRSVR